MIYVEESTKLGEGLFFKAIQEKDVLDLGFERVYEDCGIEIEEIVGDAPLVKIYDKDFYYKHKEYNLNLYKDSHRHLEMTALMFRWDTSDRVILHIDHLKQLLRVLYPVGKGEQTVGYVLANKSWE